MQPRRPQSRGDPVRLKENYLHGKIFVHPNHIITMEQDHMPDESTSPQEPQAQKPGFPWLIIVIIILALLAGGYYYFTSQEAQSQGLVAPGWGAYQDNYHDLTYRIQLPEDQWKTQNFTEQWYQRYYVSKTYGVLVVIIPSDPGKTLEQLVEEKDKASQQGLGEEKYIKVSSQGAFELAGSPGIIREEYANVPNQPPVYLTAYTLKDNHFVFLTLANVNPEQFGKELTTVAPADKEIFKNILSSFTFVPKDQK